MAAAAAAALRRLGSRVSRPLPFVKGKTGMSDRKNMKGLIAQGWRKLDERVKGTILETCTKYIIVTVWGAGVLTVTNFLERLGVTDTELSNTVKQREGIAAMVKEEYEKLKNQHDDDRAAVKKLSADFAAHRALTKLWLSHLIEKTMDPLTRQEISKIQQAFGLFDKEGDGYITRDEASAVLLMLGETISEEQLQKLVLDTGKISLPEFLHYIADMVKGLSREARQATEGCLEQEEQASGKVLPGSP